MSLLIPGHHTYILARALILEMPGWSSCNSCSTACLPGGGMTILVPHMIYPSNNESSSQLDEYSSRSGSPSLGHPSWTYCRTCDSFLSCWVQDRISVAVTGESSRCSANNTSSGSTVVLAGSSGSGRRLRASALA